MSEILKCPTCGKSYFFSNVYNSYPAYIQCDCGITTLNAKSTSKSSTTTLYNMDNFFDKDVIKIWNDSILKEISDKRDQKIDGILK